MRFASLADLKSEENNYYKSPLVENHVAMSDNVDSIAIEIDCNCAYMTYLHTAVLVFLDLEFRPYNYVNKNASYHHSFLSLGLYYNQFL